MNYNVKDISFYVYTLTFSHQTLHLYVNCYYSKGSGSGLKSECGTRCSDPGLNVQIWMYYTA
jgi:hypothetical protein